MQSGSRARLYNITESKKITSNIDYPIPNSSWKRRTSSFCACSRARANHIHRSPLTLSLSRATLGKIWRGSNSKIARNALANLLYTSTTAASFQHPATRRQKFAISAQCATRYRFRTRSRGLYVHVLVWVCVMYLCVDKS